jgi:hypothetical protein
MGTDTANLRHVVLYSSVCLVGTCEPAGECRWLRERQTPLWMAWEEDRHWSQKKQVDQEVLLSYSLPPKVLITVRSRTVATLTRQSDQ